MTEEEVEKGLTLDKKTIDVLVAQVIPTSKYFEVRFDHMQDQINGLRYDLKEFKSDVNKRFDSVDKRFDLMKADMDQRFERVDQRFAQVDKRFEQMIASIDRLTDKLDYRDEKQRSFTLRMFTISITISVTGVLGIFLKIFGVF